jgi:hypothetical protein
MTTMTAELVSLLKTQWITPLDALQQAKCLSLSQRCGEMARAGYRVEKKWRDLGNGKRVMAYRIVE